MKIMIFLLVTLALISSPSFAQQSVKINSKMVVPVQHIELADQVDWGSGNPNCHGRIQIKDSGKFTLKPNKIILSFEIEKKASNTEMNAFPLKILVVDALHGNFLTFVHLDQILFETQYEVELDISTEAYQQLMADSFVGLDFYTGKAGCEGKNLRVTYLSNLK